MSPLPISLPLVIFMNELLQLYRGTRYARKTHQKMKQVLTSLMGMAGVTTTADLTTATMSRYVESMGPHANPNTVNGLLDYARAACSYAVEEGYLGKAPSWKRVRPRGRKPELNRPLTYDEAAALGNHLRDAATTWEGRRLHALYSLILLTGIRRNEALYARVRDLDLPARGLRITEHTKRLKTFESARTVPLPLILAGVLEEWRPHVGSSPWLFPGVRRMGPWAGDRPAAKRSTGSRPRRWRSGSPT